MFERFWKSEEGRNPLTGTGLGLYISRQIVETHGGSIACRSEPDEGTALTVNLPGRDAHVINEKEDI
jgi:signal transduction histidine kinase